MVVTTLACGGDPMLGEVEEVEPTTVEIVPGELFFDAFRDTARLSATLFDPSGDPSAQSIAWLSLDTTVVQVDEGLVAAVGAGVTNVTAGAGRALDSVRVTVTQVADSISVAPSSLLLAHPGDTARLSHEAFDRNGYTISGDVATWVAADTSVVVVDGGAVTAVAAGASVVTARSASAEGAVIVTVLEPLGISTESLPTAVYGERYSASLSARGGRASYMWGVGTSDLPPGLTLDGVEGVISGEPLAEGVFDFVVEVTDSLEQSATASLVIEVSMPPVLGVDESCQGAPRYSPVTFEDPALDSLLHDELGLPSGAPLRCEELATIDTLVAFNAGLTSVRGIQNLQGLRVFALALDTVDHLDRVGDITGLRHLNLLRTPAPEIEWVDRLVALEKLWLRRTETTDLSPIVGLPALVEFISDSNSFESLSPLAGLRSLRRVDIVRQSQIVDVSPLASLPDLSQLELSDTGVDQGDVAVIAGFTSLTELAIRGAGITDIGPLASLTDLETLDLSRNPVGDFTPLAGLGSLDRLTLEYMGMTDLSWIGALTSLRTLNLTGNDLSDVSSLASLVSLEVLELSENPNIESVAAVASLVELSRLHINDLPMLDDLEALVENSGIGAGDTVLMFRVGAIDCADVEVLRSRGALVESEVCLVPLN